MPDWKFSEGSRQVKLGCKISRCMKKVENHSTRGSTANFIGAVFQL